MKILGLAILLVVLVGCGSPNEQPEVPQASTIPKAPAASTAPSSNSAASSKSSAAFSSSESSESTVNSAEAISSSSIIEMESTIHQDVIQAACAACHNPLGVASNQSLLFAIGDNNVEQENLTIFNAFALNTDARWLLEVAAGGHNHGGGQQLVEGSESFAIVVEYLEDITGEDLSEGIANQKKYTIESPATTYRRASLLLTGEIPEENMLIAIDGSDETTLRTAILELMHGDGFKAFLKRGANDQLLVRSLLESKNLRADFQYYYPIFRESYIVDNTTDLNYLDRVLFELAEAPLELIAHVVLNDRPYSEILTASYTMVSEQTARIYKTELSPQSGEFLPAINFGQHVSESDKRHPFWDWDVSRAVTIPHAGVLTEPSFLQQYPTTATNRNRARAHWVYKHFLGFDIESAMTRTISNTALLDDTENPTLNNIACTRCHSLIDPMAGAFQNFSERGMYKANAGGIDSLDEEYKTSPLYTEGDTWYADMLPPAFNGIAIASKNASVQALAKLLVEDSRFNSAAVKFWWPAIFGEPMFSGAQPSSQYSEKSKILSSLANAFGASQQNLRQLLVDMIMSDWFRAQAVEPANTTSLIVSSGGRRLLTPEELANKTASLTGVYDDHLVNEMAVLYGGIDSFNTTERLRNLNAMMLRAAERHALTNACNIIVSEFSSAAPSRYLFNLVEPYSTPSAAYTQDIIFSEIEKQSVDFSITVQALPEQRISYVMTSLTDVFEDNNLNNTEIYNITVIDPNGAVVLDGDARLLYREHDWVTGEPAGAWNAPIKLRNGFGVSIEVPVSISGTYVLRLSLAAAAIGNHLNITVSPHQLQASASDAASTHFRLQMAKLIERMHGKRYEQNSPAVLAYTQLFIDLRNNRLLRGGEKNIVESGLRCGYSSGGVPTRIWGADPFLNLGAWRGVMVSLMTDFNYLYE